MRPININQQVTVAADQDGICTSQMTGAAGPLTIDGALTVDGVGILDTSRAIALTTAGDLSAITFTITGTNNQGTVISESLSGPTASQVSTVTGFLTVTSVVASAAVAVDVEVGTTGVAFSDAIPLDQYISPFNVSIGLTWAGEQGTNDANVTVQFTIDSVFDSTGPYTWADAVNPPDNTLIDQTQSVQGSSGSLVSPVSAVRLVTNSGTGEVTMLVQQAGLF